MNSDREIVFTRVFEAPRELVWKVWTQPEHVIHWWGPNGFSLTIDKMEVRTGGVWNFVMHGPDGTDYRNRVTFLEVVEPERIVFDHGGEGDTADALFRGTTTFVDRDGKTEVTMRQLFATAAVRNHMVEKYGVIEGGHQHFARLAEYLVKVKGEKQ